MAEISVDFRNSVDSKKCAVSSPRIVNLEIRDESPGCTSESAFHGFFLNDQVFRNDVKSNSSLICGCDNQSDKNFLIHSQSSLSTSTCDKRPSDKIKSTKDIDFGLLDLLNSTKLEEALESGVKKNSVSKKNTSGDKMKIISNVEVSGGLSDLLSSIAHESPEKDEVNATFEFCRRENTQDCGIDLLDFDFARNECAKDSVSSNNSSLKVESNLSELLSSINIEDSDTTNVGSFNSSNMCNSKVVNNLKTEKEPCVPDLSDLLSSIDLGNSNDNKVDSCNQGNMCNTKVVETKNETCLADLLASINMDKSNKAVLEKESHVADLSDLLSSIDFENCNNSKVGLYNRVNMCNTTVVETKNESCSASLLQSVDIDKMDKPALALLNNKPLSFGSTNLFSKDSNGISDSHDDFAFDPSCSSSSNSCASSFSETENNSPNSLTKNNLLTDKMLESESGYSSFDSAPKEFSFFDYSSNNQFSFNTLLTKKSDVNIATKYNDCEDARNTNEEMSMSDLLTIVSPEFKNPVLANLNKVGKLDSSVNEDCSSMLDLIESLNIKSKNSDVISNNLVEKLRDYDCVDGQISKKGVETIYFQADGSLEKDTLIGRSDILNDDDKIGSDDEQITFIDLRECIKSAKHQFTPTSPIKQVKSVENQSLECFSPSKVLFYCEEKSPSYLSQNSSNPFEFNDTVPRKKIRVNTKQTMFSKALACKPKKDESLLQKVANIKHELLANIIHRPVLIDCDVPLPIIESVQQSDKCILLNAGRRSFGLDAPCELQ